MVTRDLEKRGRLVLGTKPKDADHLEELAQPRVELATSCPLPPAVTSKQLLAASLWRAPKTLTVATLFLGTEGDRMVHPSCTLRLAAHFHAPVVMHPWAGHEIPLDDPDWVAARVREWLGELAP
ncbi:MAG: alpha/beta hydrolase [Planctomycetes bacterium]|nr:alpha/beta hydrolase [Planctomycetota bacterium]